MASEKCLGKGSPEPGPVPQGLIRVYSMRFCPYAERTRLVLKAKGIKHEVVNINLGDKPDWFLKKNPAGKVPVLETDTGEIICESSVTCEFLDDQYEGKKLLPSCALGKAKQRMLLERYSEAVTLFYKSAMGRKNGEDISALEPQIKTKLKALEEGKKTDFFAGDSVGMIDYLIWPWLERENAFGLTKYLEATPQLRKWIECMKKDPAVKEVMHPDGYLDGFVNSWLSGNPNYDYGL
ncbi:glutathione S-transferase omega-1-like [Neosynchiropus ocellatus]